VRVLGKRSAQLRGRHSGFFVVGEFRVLHDHWTKQRAYDEMLKHGFHWYLPDLREAWTNFEHPALLR